MTLCIAGTGHRPNKLGGYGKDVQQRLYTLALQQLQALGATEVISGMALGWDQAVAQAATRLALPWKAYVPFEGQELQWPALSQAAYHSLLRDATEVVVCSEGGYSGKAMQERNERMVDDCDLLLALWDGTGGGTANCLRYAHVVERKVVNCWDSWKR